MNSNYLANLVKTGQLKAEASNLSEFNGLLRSGQARLKDAIHSDLAIESSFDLTYNAAHSLASCFTLAWISLNESLFGFSSIALKNLS